MAFTFDNDSDLKEILEIKFLSLKFKILNNCPELLDYGSGNGRDLIRQGKHFLLYLDNKIIPMINDFHDGSVLISTIRKNRKNNDYYVDKYGSYFLDIKASNKKPDSWKGIRLGNLESPKRFLLEILEDIIKNIEREIKIYLENLPQSK